MKEVDNGLYKDIFFVKDKETGRIGVGFIFNEEEVDRRIERLKRLASGDSYWEEIVGEIELFHAQRRRKATKEERTDD